MALPAGTVTLMFSDIEGATRLLEQLGEGYAEVLDEHRRIIRGAVAAHGGHELRTEGDAFFVVFARVGDAVRAAVAAQRALAACTWSRGVTVRVRMGLHTGEPRVAGRDYVGIDVHRAARICSAAHGGQVVVSETTERILAGEAIDGVGLHDLGEHRLKDLTRPMRLYQIVGEGLTVGFPPLRVLEHPPKGLSGQWAPPTELFGREADLAALARLVREPGNRLVTLVGPGGVGKTRLAIAAAGDVAGYFADGAWFVALAAVSEPRDLAPAIVRELSAPVRQGEPARAALIRFLADRRVLLVLDNIEQLLDGAPLVADLLGACRGLMVLVTSREPTRLAAEQLYPVRPLAVPDASAIDVEGYGAVAMFVDRVRSRDPAFDLDESNAPHVCEICRRLDGLPLALELAAARFGLLSVPELAARLDRALAMLVGGTRDAPERQHTLRATIDWSYDLLTSEERRAFAHMAVFAGGATVAAAETVTGASLYTLDSLMAKQLLTRRDDRLLMLETVREYALERLAGEPDHDAVQQRLAAWCLRLLRDASPHLVRADRAPWLARLDAERPNTLTALSWAIEQRRAELALELIGGLGDYWWHTHWSEDARDDARRWIDAALKLKRDASCRLRAAALLNRGRLTSIRGAEGPNRDDLQESLELYRACDDARGIAACLGHLAFLESWVGNSEEATALSDQAVRYAERAHDEAGIAFARAQGVVAGLDYEDTNRRARSAMPYLRRIGNLDEMGRVCNVAGYVAIAERRYRDALAWLDEGLEATRRLDNPTWPFIIQSNRGLAWLFLDELDEAGQQFRASLALSRDAGRKEGVDETVLGLAAVEASRGHLERAARLTGAAKAHELRRQVDEDTVWSRLTDDILAPARARYGLEHWDLAEREGGALNVHDAIDLALERGRFAPKAATGTAAAPR